jgi:hypothetical protein
LDENLQGIVEFSTTIDDVVAEKNRLLLAIRRVDVVKAVNLLEAGNLLVSKSNGELIVKYRRFRPPRIEIGEGEDEQKVEVALDYTKRGVIRAISRGTARKEKQRRSPSRRSSRGNGNQLDLPFRGQ